MKRISKVLLACFFLLALVTAGFYFIRIQSVDFKLSLIKLRLLVTAAKHGYVLNSMPTKMVTLRELPALLKTQKSDTLPSRLQGIWWTSDHPYGAGLIIFRSIGKKNKDTNEYSVSDGIYYGNNIFKTFVFFLVRHHTKFIFHWVKNFKYASIVAKMDYPFQEKQAPAALFEGYDLNYEPPKKPTPGERRYLSKEGHYAHVCFCSLHYKNENLIARENYGSEKRGYTLKRIIDGKDQKTAYYQDFKKKFRNLHFFKIIKKDQ